MIVDSITNIDRYVDCIPRGKEVAEILRNLSRDYANLEKGRIEIDGDLLYAVKIDMDGVGDASVLETHEKYLDIQYTQKGCDLIGWKLRTDEKSKEGYKEELDAELFPEEKSDVTLNMPEGMFAVFFPSDMHAPLGTTEHVQKLVIKVQLVQ